MYLMMSLILMAGVTYIPRVLPITLFEKEIKSPFVRSLLYYVPYAVLGAMTFPSMLYAPEKVSYGLIGLIAAALLGYFEKSLTVVAISTVGIVYLCHFLI